MKIITILYREWTKDRILEDGIQNGVDFNSNESCPSGQRGTFWKIAPVVIESIDFIQTDEHPFFLRVYLFYSWNPKSVKTNIHKPFSTS